ncbi:MAG TPA: bifunctional diaminohydroxyphosphoribosylaminopyrimidine deaminase/5-amino-6-(5-phosphoribosylamino)uracil reductase RibD [Thermoanaerobaculia bacterium]|nr:bifunctional diaminohydroxyphosphoribosylaminopyrimidine deaminase/5-amino-6-(5-phosphoribosylamino)uracil reductase RibD [Thermoanaerobaculia bacterium]
MRGRSSGETTCWHDADGRTLLAGSSRVLRGRARDARSPGGLAASSRVLQGRARDARSPRRVGGIVARVAGAGAGRPLSPLVGGIVARGAGRRLTSTALRARLPPRMEDDHAAMRRALELARLGLHSVSPNPMVGCVIARGSTVIGEGFHRRAGEPHAEVEALSACREDPAGATVYVSLEPCAHTGRTPPCAEALVNARVARVVIATRDPNTLVDGQGIERLRAAGIAVEAGLLEEEARRLNEVFLHSVRTRLPFVVLKGGMSLDGKLATINRESRWITSTESRQRNFLLREEHDAILVGSGTVVTDDPELTRRLGLNTSITPWIRAIVDSRGKIPASSTLLADDRPTVLFTTRPERYEGAKNTEVIASVSDGEGRIDLLEVLRALYERGVRSVIVEGGSALHTDVIRRRLWQKMILFIAPVLLGGESAPALYSPSGGVSRLTDAPRFRFDSVERSGNDLVVTAYPDQETAI